MLFSQFILPLLPVASAISLHGLTRRSGSQTHGQAVQAIQRSSGPSTGNSTLIPRDGERKVKRTRRSIMVGKGTKHAKRLVRSKKRACKAPSSTIAQPSATAQPTASPSPASSSAAAPSPSEVNNGWFLTDNWVRPFYQHTRRYMLIATGRKQLF